MGLLKIVSWNIAGCTHVIKRKKILTYLKHKKVDIALIQETHLNGEESEKLKRDWVGQIYYSTVSARKRGVITLVKKNIDFRVLKHISDNEGRWVILDAMMEGQRVTVANIYGPNSVLPDFFHNVCNIIRNMGNNNIIIGGDFNQVRDLKLDRSSQSNQSSYNGSASMIAIELMMKELGLVDIWRLLHPHERDYTFFSHPHTTYSRIDYFLLSGALVNQVVGATIGNIVVTDHAPVDLVLSPQENEEKVFRWRFDNYRLNGEEYCAFVRTVMGEFWEFNEGSVSDSGVMWDAFKAYVRGRLIQHSALAKRVENEKMLKLDKDIKELEKRHIQHPDPETWRKLNTFKYDLNNILLKKAESALFYAKQKYYEQGERAGKLLAHRVKKRQTQNIISSIYNKNNELITNKKLINGVFETFYQELYTSQGTIDESKLDSFLSTITMPTLTETQRDTLEGDITIEEIQQAVLNLSMGKTPGDDGFTSDFYKKFIDVLAPRLQTVYQDALKKGELPRSMRSAIITLLHKKGKDPQYCGSYRPISLINVDEKVLAKILATRLEEVTPLLIHPDQVGFVKGRSSADNMRRLLHLMWKTRNVAEPVVAFSLDAEKAFDRVEFSFLFSVLGRYGFGSSFLQWVQLMYTDPMATVLTNGIVSPSFRLSRGTRQGSPLSPHIFALFLEPLALALRANENIVGIKAGQEEHKLFLYADDILVVSSNPQRAAAEIISVIDTFSEISGYTINWTKSEAMPLSKVCPPVVREKWKFRWMPTGLTYLGIKLTPGLDKIMESNIAPIIRNIQSLLQNWTRMTISLLGRINLVKMIIAPKIQYIIYMLPLSFPRLLLKRYNTVIERFIWMGKKPLFNRAKLYAAKEQGGLSLAKIDWYHYAFSLSQLSKMNLPTEQAPAWVRIEEELVYPSPLEAFLTQMGRAIPFKNPVLSFARESWGVTHHMVKSNACLTPKSSIWYNKKLLINKKTLMWNTWARSGIHLLGDLFRGEGMKSFEEVKLEYNLDKSDFWRFLQIRHCILGQVRSILNPQTEIQDLFHTTWMDKGGASIFYKHIRGAHAPRLEGLKVCWEKDVGEDISTESWEKMVASWHRCSRETQSQLVHYKVLNRSYWTPCKMAKLRLRDSDVCWRCGKESGTLVHLLYYCEKTIYMWDNIIDFLNGMLELSLSKTPSLCILGLLPENVKMSNRMKLWVQFALMTGCRINLRHWKSSASSTYNEWMETMYRMATYERITYRMMGREDMFHKIWGSFLAGIGVS